MAWGADLGPPPAGCQTAHTRSQFRLDSPVILGYHIAHLEGVPMNRSEQAHQGRELNVADSGAPGDERADEYQAPEIVVHDGDAFVKRLGPAQACSPGPT